MGTRNRGNYLIIERLRIIEDTIKKGNYPNTNILQKKIRDLLGFEFSIQTINRDMRFLKERMDYPIEYDAHRKGYYWK